MPGEPNDSHALPPGLVVLGTPAELTRCFAALVPLQPVAWTPAGLVCAPRAAGELAGPALARCPLPTRPCATVPGWPDPPADLVGGWYRRSVDHATAPAGVRELVLAAGAAFGHITHPTTAMCLAVLDRLPHHDALDLGCGAGLLTQAWLRLTTTTVAGRDLDPGAVAQARASLAAAGLADRAQLATGPAEQLASHADGRVVLANVPAHVHVRLLEHMAGAPAAAVLSGLRPGQATPIVAGYRARGLRVIGAHRRGGWECWVMGR